MPTTITTDQAQATIFKALEELVDDPSLVAREATFEELGLDSLDLVEVGQIVEDDLGVRLLREDLKGIKDVGDVVDLVVASAAR